jgi:hypothetical protein
VRPNRLRIEMPGPAGARFILVADGDRLFAVFPGERAFFAGAADAETLARVTGVRLAAPAVIDMLTGRAPADASDYRADWADSLPKRVSALLSDGTRLKIGIERPQTDRPVSGLAFEPPPHEGYREVTAEEARELWLGRR